MDGACRDNEAGLNYVAGLERCFFEVEDPRVVGRCDHLLLDILAIVLLAMLCGAEDWPDIELFAKARLEFLKTFLALPCGIPSHDTFRRVLGRLDRQQFAAGLFAWTQALHAATSKSVIAIDGKTLRRSFSKARGLGMLHLVTAWATEQHLTLAQVACEEKSNEITAIPELLRLLSLNGATVTIDAMGCQTEIAAQIRQQKGHYLLQVKGHQPTLEKNLVDHFQTCLETDFAGVAHDSCETTSTGHGRRETRIVHAVELPQEFPNRGDWKDIRTLVVVTSQRVVRSHRMVDGRAVVEETETLDSRSYITDLKPRAAFLSAAIRAHWSIENSQHWILDVTFAEDSRRQQDRNGAANLAAVRRLANSLLRQENSNTRGAKNKRLNCALDTNYLLKVLKTSSI
jgi:predicted transposase YbfD/YdcC